MVRKVSIAEQVRTKVPAIETPASIARKNRYKNRHHQSGLGYGQGWRRTEEDQQLLEAVTRIGAISIRQAQRYIYKRTLQQARKRIGKMVDAGLLERIDTVSWAGVIIWPTSKGRKAAFPDNNHPLASMEPPSESTMVHRLLVAEYALAYLTEGYTIITEREARAFEVGTALFNIDNRLAFLEQAGVRRGTPTIRGVNPTKDDIDGQQVERWLTMKVSDGNTTYRIPDFLIVTNHGELQAIEVEPTAKNPSRTKHILTAYRDTCLNHNPAPFGTHHTLKTTGPKYGQYTSVHWIASEQVETQLRGHNNGINPMTGKPDKGMIRNIWDQSINTRLFFDHPNTWALDNPAWPIMVEPINVSQDPGLEYILAQRNLSAYYRCSMTTWHKWRTIWEADMKGEPHPVPFTQWIRLDGNLTRCKKLAK